MLVQRRRRCANISPALARRLVFAGLVIKHDTLTQCQFNVGPASETVDKQTLTLGQRIVFAGRGDTY